MASYAALHALHAGPRGRSSNERGVVGTLSRFRRGISVTIAYLQTSGLSREQVRTAYLHCPRWTWHLTFAGEEDSKMRTLQQAGLMRWEAPDEHVCASAVYGSLYDRMYDDPHVSPTCSIQYFTSTCTFPKSSFTCDVLPPYEQTCTIHNSQQLHKFGTLTIAQPSPTVHHPTIRPTRLFPTPIYQPL